MQIIYCDLCGQPIKDGELWSMYLTKQELEPPTDMNDVNEYYKRLDKITKEMKEICPSCKYVFDKLFELRLQNLNALSNELLGIYKLDTYEDKSKTKDKKKEK